MDVEQGAVQCTVVPCVSVSLCFSNFDARGKGDILRDIHKPLGAIFKGQVQAGCKMSASPAETFVILSAVGAFAKLRKATISYVMSVRLSIDGFS